MPGSAPANQRLGTLVAAHHASVWRSLRRLGVGDGDVDDAAQQVFLIAYRKLADIAEECERSFLLQTALRVAADYRRSRMRRREQDGVSLVDIPDLAASPEELLDQRRARALLDRILSMMPIELREVFVLFEIEEMRMTEVARVVGLRAGTAASRLRRARELFRKHVERVSAEASSRRGMGGTP